MSIFNVNQPPVDDVRVRRAFSLAQDLAQLIEVLGGKGIMPAATQFFSKDSPWYSKKVAAAYPTNNPTEAKALLASYMADPKRSDGKKPGDPVAIQFACPPDPTYNAYAQALQQMEANVGFQVDLQQVEQATLIQNAYGAPPFTSANYMIQCWRHGDQNDPDSALFYQFSNPLNNPASVSNYNNPEVQALLVVARANSDFKTRYNAYEKIGMIFDRDALQTWVGSTVASVYFKPTVQGIPTWIFPDGKSKGKTEMAMMRLGQLWVGK